MISVQDVISKISGIDRVTGWLALDLLVLAVISAAVTYIPQIDHTIISCYCCLCINFTNPFYINNR